MSSVNKSDIDSTTPISASETLTPCTLTIEKCQWKTLSLKLKVANVKKKSNLSMLASRAFEKNFSSKGTFTNCGISSKNYCTDSSSLKSKVNWCNISETGIFRISLKIPLNTHTYISGLPSGRVLNS